MDRGWIVNCYLTFHAAFRFHAKFSFLPRWSSITFGYQTLTIGWKVGLVGEELMRGLELLLY
jgi:hypothetical protein